MTEPRIWYVVQAVQPWSALSISVGVGSSHPIEVSGDPEDPVGFLAVFDTRKQAEKWANSAPISQIISAEVAEL